MMFATINPHNRSSIRAFACFEGKAVKLELINYSTRGQSRISRNEPSFQKTIDCMAMVQEHLNSQCGELRFDVREA